MTGDDILPPPPLMMPRLAGYAPTGICGGLKVGDSLIVENGVHSQVGYFERGRAYSLGQWQNWPITWTNGQGGVQPVKGDGDWIARYCVVGYTCFFHVKINMGTTGNAGTGIMNLSLPPFAYVNYPTFYGMHYNGGSGAYSPLFGIMSPWWGGPANYWTPMVASTPASYLTGTNPVNPWPPYTQFIMNGFYEHGS